MGTLLGVTLLFSLRQPKEVEMRLHRQTAGSVGSGMATKRVKVSCYAAASRRTTRHAVATLLYYLRRAAAGLTSGLECKLKSTYRYSLSIAAGPVAAGCAGMAMAGGHYSILK